MSVNVRRVQQRLRIIGLVLTVFLTVAAAVDGRLWFAVAGVVLAIGETWVILTHRSKAV